MGGSIAVLVRFSGGETVCTNASTNPTPYWFTHPGLLEDADAHLRRYLDPERGDGEEWPRPTGLAPHGYGLVVVDAKLRKITSMQGYTDYTRILQASAMVELRNALLAYRYCEWSEEQEAEALRSIRPDDPAFEHMDALTRLKGFVERGVPLVHRDFEPDGEVRTPLAAWLGAEPTWPNLLARLIETEIARTKASFAEFVVDMSPWSIGTFDEDLDGSRAFRAVLAADGFEVDAEAWDAWDKGREL